MIVGYIQGQSLEITQPTVVADTINFLTAQFVFLTSEWDSLTKIAHFKQGENDYPFILQDDKITAEMQLNLTAGKWEIYLHGNDENAITRATTEPQEITVKSTGNVGDLGEISTTAEEQIIGMAARAERIANEANKKAEDSQPYAEAAKASANEARISAQAAANSASDANDSVQNAAKSEKNAEEAASRASSAASIASNAADTAASASENAKSFANSAETAKTTATTAMNISKSAAEQSARSSTAANNSANRAEAAASNPPIIGNNGNWYTWDKTTGAYVDTGLASRGESGIPLVVEIADPAEGYVLHNNVEYHITFSEKLTLEIDFNTNLDGTESDASRSGQVMVIFTVPETETEPPVSFPENVIWAIATPVFEASKTYMLSFVPCGDDVIGIWAVIG